MKGNLKKPLISLHVIAAFVIGALLGTIICEKGRNNRDNSIISSPRTKIVGSIQHLSKAPFRNTSHKDELGRPITKQQFIEPFLVPKVAGFSVATLLPGQRVEKHEHASMHEFFYVLEGTGIFWRNGIPQEVQSGTFLHYAPHESHEIFVPEGTDGKMKFFFGGVVED